MESKFFGKITQEAVIRFQEKYSQEILKPWRLTKGTGIVGPKTREKINSILDILEGKK
ncbi:MAG: peptidoglycan-binding domain-containing protein [Minisyncoccales bacterium]